ncbi:MAG: type I DNA topoisomerase [Candidatus Pacebacteria bacterium]|nr:type I DNA topoisomerase [Candidatus Paceibacterota bacterium]MBP9058066.1 type I DNA topoisomerase [Candidatus Paceibacterota bacterium]MBP9769960.1 type I DNA topoisomerase [Candidatus Paceibacterota bacterium]
MKLLIVESPSKAKTIEKYLDGAFTVRASVGHIRDLPKSNKKAIDIEGGFIPHYENSPGKIKVIHELQHLAEKAESIVLATDPDREGEAISWHLKQILDEDKKVKAKIKRVTFHEITKEAVEEALKNPRDIDDKLVKAQEARRVLDRLVGYDLSGLIWKKVRYGLSAGRVQSPALRIIMEREREIRAFIPEKFWVLEADTKTEKKSPLLLTCSEEPRDENLVNKILEKGKAGKWKVLDVKGTEQKRVPRAPFTTSTLQQTASTRLGFSPSRTMQVAQKLYEAGHITYMRTDSTNISAQAKAQAISEIEKRYGKELAEEHTYKTKSKNAQEAHEAIRPTHFNLISAGTTEEQKKLYRLIWERTVSSQMVDAKVLRTKITAEIEGENLPEFQANGSRILSLGWLTVDTAARGEDVELPEVKAGEYLQLVDLRSIEKATEPPNRYSEAGLVKELEARGIGRPSTYASIMRTLEERGYVTKEGRTLFPTDTGDVVSTFLEANFIDYISDTFTAEMEDKLDEIAEGKREYAKTLKDFYGPFLKDVKAKDKLEKITNLGEAPKEFPCPVCGAEMIVKLGKNGKFLSCSKFPDCVGGRTIDGKIMEGPKEIGEPCPDCGEKHGGKLVIREGRFGMFISCSRYPKCKFIKEDEEERKKKLTGVQCPNCKKGEMMERRGKFGIFYSCSNYPDCKTAIKAKPTGNICDMCGALMMEGTKTIPERCSNNKCPNHRPDKLVKK